MIPAPERIALVGLRGAGKTTFGKLLAQRLNLPFLDADQTLQEKEGKSITQIFAEKGQDWFRDRESETLLAISQAEKWVLACGGGVVLREENRIRLKERAFVIWLHGSPDILASRVFQDPHSATGRPSLVGNGSPTDGSTFGTQPAIETRTLAAITHELELLAQQREKLYQSVSRIWLDTGHGNPEDWLQFLLANWKCPMEESATAGVPWK